MAAILVALLAIGAAAEEQPARAETTGGLRCTQIPRGAQESRIAPALLLRCEPEYTKEAREKGIEGDVVLEVEIGADGRVATGDKKIRVTHSLGSGLDEKAIEAVRQWRFLPAYRGGEPVSTPATIEVNFRLSAVPLPKKAKN